MAKKSSDEITNLVYEYRVLKRLTQQDLAKAVGVSRQTIQVMEKNKYTPSLLFAFKLAEFFEADINEIFKYKNGGYDD
ncbi:helix-turn-helix transcriptional regulator [Paraliobacillus zengyii]|uniref:helix-turn-helix transcriptional regulator n=1 Tax=Paraliobacillus zengyii TaxID=2213194 RepID=UPI000DD3E0E9|nr:helix-turn-helix transcriptional regulator [Paraliobacillus zengyii]